MVVLVGQHDAGTGALQIGHAQLQAIQPDMRSIDLELLLRGEVEDPEREGEIDALTFTLVVNEHVKRAWLAAVGERRTALEIDDANVVPIHAQFQQRRPIRESPLDGHELGLGNGRRGALDPDVLMPVVGARADKRHNDDQKGDKEANQNPQPASHERSSHLLDTISSELRLRNGVCRSRSASSAQTRSPAARHTVLAAS